MCNNKEVLAELRELRKLVEKSNIIDKDYDPVKTGLYIIKNNPNVNISQLSEVLGISRQTIYRHINK